MEFVLQDGFHDEHDSAWAVFSQHYHCPVCLGCMVETLENSQLLCIQKTPAITELLRLLTYQSSDVLQLFIQEEQVVWHLAEILLECLKGGEESFLSSIIDTCLKLIQQIGSEDLVVFYLDGIYQQVVSLTNHDVLLPHYTLLGKLLYQLPPLAAKLLQDYDHLLHQISLELCSPREAIQSAVAYLFIFLCDSQLMGSMSLRLKQQLQQGVLKMLAAVQTQAVQVNGLGLLKKLLIHEDGCHILMSLNVEGTTLLGALKKLLLSKREVLQIGVAHILNLLLQKQAGNQYGTAILESDLAEFLFEALHTQNVIQMESTLTTLHQLSKTELFYKRCHAVYGVESVLRSLGTALELKNPTLLKIGYSLLAEILQRQPPDIPLFVSVSVVKNCLSLIKTGILHHQTSVNSLAIKTASVILRKEHLMLPVPFFELSGILTAVAEKAWDQLRDVSTVKLKNSSRNQSMERETRESLLQTYVSMLSSAVRLAIQCKSEPVTCESAFTAPSSGSIDSVPPLQSYIQTVFQIIDENCIPFFMIQWDKTEQVDLYRLYFDMMISLQDLDQSVSDGIVNKLVEAGFLMAVLDVKAKYRREAALVDSVERFLSLALRSTLIKEGLGPSTQEFEELKETVKNMNWTLTEIRQAFCDDSACVDKETLEAYLTVLYLCYRHDNRPVEAEDLQLFLSWIVENFTSLEQLSTLARKHYLFLLAWGVVNEDMDMRSSIPNGIQSVAGVLNQSKESWYTHDVLMVQWCYTDVVLATLSGTAVLKAYLESCVLDELKDCLSDAYNNHHHALSRLSWDPVFRQNLLDCITRGRTDIVSKARIVLEHHLQQICSSDLGNDGLTDDNGLEELYTRLADVLHNVFLKNYPEAEEHNLVSLLELLLKVQKLRVPKSCIDIKILYHVLNQFGPNKDLSDDLKDVCLQIVAISIFSSRDNQVNAIVVQNEELLFLVETSIREKQSTLNVSCDILNSLIQSSNIVQVPYSVSLHLPSLINCIYGGTVDSQIALLHLLASVLKVKMSTPVVKFTGQLSSLNYCTLYIYLQQFIVQDICQLQEAAVICLEGMISYLLQTHEELAVELLNQPWNQLLLDILIELILETGWSKTILKLFHLFLDNDAGIAAVTSSKTLPHKIVQCFHGNKIGFATEIKRSDDTDLKRNLASLVSEKLRTFLTQAERNILQEFTSKT